MRGEARIAVGFVVNGPSAEPTRDRARRSRYATQVTHRRSPEGPPIDTMVDAKRTRLGVGVGGRSTESMSIMDEPDLVGTVVGGYLVQAKLGAGAMGVVYKAVHLDTNRVVALKALRSNFFDEANAIQRFRREAQVAARLGHPHVGGLVEVVEAQGRFALALELVEGEPLRVLIDEAIVADRVIVLAGQLLRGLEHAHALGLVHRDLKPDNVLVDKRNGRDHARIIDFGIAIAAAGSSDSIERLTAEGVVIGTPEYMSPEQSQGLPVDERSDLYSLGMILYELLTGLLPFVGRPVQILYAKLKRDPPPMAEREPSRDYDPLLELFVRKLLAREPEQRFANARAALGALHLIVHEPANAGPAVGLMDVERALAVVALPSRRRP